MTKENSILNLQNKRLVIESYYNQTFSGYSMSYHMHNTFELFYIDGGKCKFFFFDPETKKHETVSLKSGEYLFIDADAFHRLEVAENSPCRILQLEFKALDALKDSLDLNPVISRCPGLQKAFSLQNHIHIFESDALRRTLQRVHSLMNRDRRLYVDHPFTQILLGELLFNMDECYSEYYLNNPYIQKITDYIMHNYREDLSLKGVADAVRLNVSYMQKLFLEATGMTVWSFIKKHRIEKAISLIRNTSLHFSDIAYEVGFQNRQTFFNVFTDIMGITPKQYKKYLAEPLVNYRTGDYRAEVTIDDRLKV